tara:strand:- start:391 stop:3795 length:3405 start_codon:yes stop_codon:yes gene_type:complete
MPKDLRIELLQNRQNVRIGEPMLQDQYVNNPAFWHTGSSIQSSTSLPNLWVISGGVITKSLTTGSSYFGQDVVLTGGHRYELEVRIHDYNRVGQILLANHGVGGVNITIANSTIIEAGADGNTSQFAKLITQWTQGSDATQIEIYANAGTIATMDVFRLYKTTSDKSSVFGTLDASTSEEFPLALTFQVNDPSNIDARKGAYSKTFQIPATSNNNKVLKHFNISNSTLLGAALFDKIKCRILVGNLFSLTGLLQIQDIVRINNKPALYSCTFLGDNLAWSTMLESKYLSDLQLANSTGLNLSAADIIKTWEADSAISNTTRLLVNSVNTSPVVYPVTTYGYTNQTGGIQANDSMQLSRTEAEMKVYTNSTPVPASSSVLPSVFHINNSTYPIPSVPYPEPVVDWRPQVWIYNMIHKIFNDVGYNVKSSFIESDNFQRLLYATPNFIFNSAKAESRAQANSFIGNFKIDTCAGAMTGNQLLFYWVTTRLNTLFTTTQGVTATILNMMVHDMPFLQFEAPPVAGCDWCYQATQVGTPLMSPDCGSNRFQPQIGSTVNSGNILQQELKMYQGGAGTTADPYYNYFLIDEAGYYNVGMKNIGWNSTTKNAGWSNNSGTISSDVNKVWVRGGLSVWALAVGHPVGSEHMRFRQDAELFEAEMASGTQISQGDFEELNYIGYFNKGDRVMIKVVYEFDRKGTDISSGGTEWVDTELKLYGTNIGTVGNTGSSNNGYVRVELYRPEIPTYACVYDLQDVLPETQKQLDFVKGIAHAFNLQFSTVESEKAVYIEPYDDFYQAPSQAIDWSWKLARDKDDTDSFMENDFSRKMVFKYKLDGNDSRTQSFADSHFEGYGVYPRIIELGTTYPAGETIFENPFFASTWDYENSQIGDMVDNQINFYSATLWEHPYGGDPSGDSKGYEFMPRMLYYRKITQGVTQLPLNQGFKASMNLANNLPYFRAMVQESDVFATGFPAIQGSYTDAIFATATAIDRYDYTNQFGLSYGNYWARDFDPITNTYNAVGDQIGKGLYERYYNAMISGLLAHPRKRVCYIDLKVTDIVQLSFRKMVYIDGIYYKLLKVIDYQPHLNVPTKVELQQWSPDKGTSLPQAGTWINTVVNTGGGGYNDDGSSTDEEPANGF